MNKPLIGLLLLSSALLSGCTSMSPEECQVANWQTIGYNDGKAGFDQSPLNDYIKDCGDAGFAVNKEAWQHGQQLGNKVYCAPENGYRVGVAGETYRGVCANEQFVKQYTLGYEVYERKQRLKEIKTELDDIDRQLKNSDNLDSDTRKYLQEKRKQLANERATLLSKPSNTYQFSFQL